MRILRAILGAALVAAAATASTLPAGATSDIGPEIRSVHQDADGNAILRTRGGAKIIVIGEGERLAAAFAAPEVIGAGTNCRFVGITVKGRSYMYGVSSGDPTPVIGRRVCD